MEISGSLGQLDYSNSFKEFIRGKRACKPLENKWLPPPVEICNLRGVTHGYAEKTENGCADKFLRNAQFAEKVSTDYGRFPFHLLKYTRTMNRPASLADGKRDPPRQALFTSRPESSIGGGGASDTRQSAGGARPDTIVPVDKRPRASAGGVAALTFNHALQFSTLCVLFARRRGRVDGFTFQCPCRRWPIFVYDY
ncbi:hypothetical protein EVAR_33520_1 [Eumeta japonica]|uniref:Uncharacterized protein n=1 Tax=Eumeta variegata TaxID=151549 RepID=A0A4C1VK45_EUMVA|nr:hypothetical protein EVAR_33520_1 [Eumeta japonica]